MSSKRAQPQITFDEFNRLRILDADYAKHTEAIVEDSAEFVKKLAQFNKSVESLSLIFNKQAEKLEGEKLKAIGERTAIETESEARRRRCGELQHSIAAVTLETERLQDYLNSLAKIETENHALIEKLAAS